MRIANAAMASGSPAARPGVASSKLELIAEG
jgi:hypothetical protein